MDLLVRRTPEIAAIEDSDHECGQAVWAAQDRYWQAMEEELLPAVGFRTRWKLLDAVRSIHGSASHVHERFRSLAESVRNPARMLAVLQARPVHEVGRSAL